MGYVVNGMRHLIYGADLAIDPAHDAGAAWLHFAGDWRCPPLAVRKNKYWTLKTLKPEIAV